MSEPTNEWLEVRANRQPERTALAARYRCTPDSTDAEWERFLQALADFDEETERIYEQLIMERYHSSSARRLNEHSRNMDLAHH